MIERQPDKAGVFNICYIRHMIYADNGISFELCLTRHFTIAIIPFLTLMKERAIAADGYFSRFVLFFSVS